MTQKDLRTLLPVEWLNETYVVIFKNSLCTHARTHALTRAHTRTHTRTQAFMDARTHARTHEHISNTAKQCECIDSVIIGNIKMTVLAQGVILSVHLTYFLWFHF